MPASDRLAPLRRAGLAIAAFCLFAPRAHATPVDMTAEQYRLYKSYQAALTDPRVEKIPESKRITAIARNFRTSEKGLREAVTKGDLLGATIGKACEQEIRDEIAATGLKGRLGDVHVDATDGHVVTYVEWRNDDGGKLEEEAATVALLASRSAPISSTIALWAKDASGRKVFEAKISADAAGRFSQDHIAMFARARYIHVFEDVHNAYTGTPPTD
jgi:hypothetical protein